MRRFLNLLIAGAVAMPVVSAHAELSAAAKKKAEPACQAAIKSKLVAPLEAQMIPGTNRFSVANDGSPAYRVCMQGRTKGGGFGKVFGICRVSDDGSVEVTFMRDSADRDSTIVMAQFCKPQ